MSVEAITWALRQPIERTTTKFVLVVLANCAHPADGRAWPSVSYLTAATAQDRKTVLKNIQVLEEAGLIEDTGDREGRTKQIVVYQLRCGTLYAVSTVESSPRKEMVPKSEQSQKRNGSKKGTVPVFQGTVPIFPGNSPNNGTRNRKGNQRNRKTTTTANAAAIDWSARGLEAFTEDDRVVVVGLLSGYDLQTQQSLLDELAGFIEDKAVKSSPMALLAKLATAARDGTFVLNRGRRVRDERTAGVQPKFHRPGESSETPYENAVNHARQMHGANGIAPDRVEFDRLVTEAADKWPEDARKFSVAASAYGRLSERSQPKNNIRTQGVTPP